MQGLRVLGCWGLGFRVKKHPGPETLNPMVKACGFCPGVCRRRGTHDKRKAGR